MIKKLWLKTTRLTLNEVVLHRSASEHDSPQRPHSAHRLGQSGLFILQHVPFITHNYVRTCNPKHLSLDSLHCKCYVQSSLRKKKGKLPL